MRLRPRDCNRGCGAKIVLLGNPFEAPGLWPFEVTEYDGEKIPAGVIAYPTFGQRAWRLPELVEHLMVTREVGRAEAEQEARHLTWRSAHRCPPQQPTANASTGDRR